MRRREFISLLACAWAGALRPAAAQLTKKPVVALVFTARPDRSLLVRTFVHELRELGWVEGRTISIEHRPLEDPQLAATLFAELVARGVDVIVLGGARWLHDAALNATRTIPLVTIFQDDPVAAGLIASLARPGANRLPAMHPFREAVEAGGLLSYGTSIPGILRQMARLTDRILKGSRPQDLPTEQATIFEVVINAKTAKILGLVVPPIMLALADEVIE